MKYELRRIDGSFICSVDVAYLGCDRFNIGRAIVSAVSNGVDLSNANLRMAYISEGANDTGLIGSGSSGANLRGASMPNVDLSDAKLSGVDLSTANMSGSDLSGIDLSGALLSGVNLSSAALNKSNLTMSNLTGADLTGANIYMSLLTGADLRGAKLPHHDITPTVKGIHKAVYAAAESNLVMSKWHSHCGTKHCWAGWIVTLAGDAGRNLEDAVGTDAVAAALILMKSDPALAAIPDWYSSEDVTLNEMARLAGE